MSTRDRLCRTVCHGRFCGGVAAQWEPLWCLCHLCHGQWPTGKAKCDSGAVPGGLQEFDSFWVEVSNFRIPWPFRCPWRKNLTKNCQPNHILLSLEFNQCWAELCFATRQQLLAKRSRRKILHPDQVDSSGEFRWLLSSVVCTQHSPLVHLTARIQLETFCHAFGILARCVRAGTEHPCLPAVFPSASLRSGKLQTPLREFSANCPDHWKPTFWGDHQVPSAFLVIALVKAHRCTESFRIGGFPGVVTSAGRSCDPLFQQRRGTFHGTGWVKVDREWSRSQLRPAKPELSDSSSVFLSFVQFVTISYNLFMILLNLLTRQRKTATVLWFCWLDSVNLSDWKTGEHRRVCNIRLKAKGKDKDERT